MDPFSLLWQSILFSIMTSYEMAIKVTDEVMFTFEDYEVYVKIVKILSFCVGNFYFCQALATFGFYLYLRRLADNFPAHPIVTVHSLVHVGPSMEQLLEEKETALNAAARKNDNLDTENAVLRAKVERLQTEVENITNDRYALVRETLILKNRLGDFNSWPEFREGYDQLTTDFIEMKKARAKEHALQERTQQIAEERKVELAAAKQAEAMSKIAHRKEIKRLQQERDEAKEKSRILLATSSAAKATPTATTAPDVTAAAATTIKVPRGNIPGDFNLLEENTRLTLNRLRSQSILLSNLSSDLSWLQSQLRSRAKHYAFKLNMATLTITALEREKAKADKRIARLEMDVLEAKAKAEEMEERYMLVAFGDGNESGRDESGSECEKEDDEGREDGGEEVDN